MIAPDANDGKGLAGGLRRHAALTDSLGKS
jgi:hypothetical protein